MFKRNALFQLAYRRSFDIRAVSAAAHGQLPFVSYPLSALLVQSPKGQLPGARSMIIAA